MERKKEKKIKPAQVVMPLIHKKNKSRNSRQPSFNSQSTRSELYVPTESKISHGIWSTGDVKRRRIMPKPKAHLNPTKYVKMYINYYDPNYFICRVYHGDIINKYPSFPLRFVSANFEYLYYEKKNYISEKEDYECQLPSIRYFFEVNISVKVKEEYWDEFGALLQYSNGSEQLILFNEKQLYLATGNVYKFSKVVALNSLGNINLRLGYYDSSTDSFYPAVYSRNKTDLSIFIWRNISYNQM